MNKILNKLTNHLQKVTKRIAFNTIKIMMLKAIIGEDYNACVDNDESFVKMEPIYKVPVLGTVLEAMGFRVPVPVDKEELEIKMQKNPTVWLHEFAHVERDTRTPKICRMEQFVPGLRTINEFLTWVRAEEAARTKGLEFSTLKAGICLATYIMGDVECIIAIKNLIEKRRKKS